MQVQGHTWDSHVIIGTRVRELTWLQRLSQRMAIYRAQRRQALLSAQKVGWDARRESVRTSPAASALECVAQQGGPALSMTLYAAHTDMACTG
jgi:hypothetical protein